MRDPGRRGGGRRHACGVVRAGPRLRRAAVVASLPIFRAPTTRPIRPRIHLDIRSARGLSGRPVRRRALHRCVADWWGAKLPVSVGTNNFDILRYEFFATARSPCRPRRRTICFARSSPRVWATRYTFRAARRSGRRSRFPGPLVPRPNPAAAGIVRDRREVLDSPRLQWTKKNSRGFTSAPRVPNSPMTAKGRPAPGSRAAGRSAARCRTGLWRAVVPR
jgi:hypothetical protein